ncbi:MAG: IPT/TIG domain-containing protein [Deltaproteobacteria bacterium]|nr:IPT/TIG domain-containing protein [Deltaproteobacteria bacterium]
MLVAILIFSLIQSTTWIEKLQDDFYSGKISLDEKLDIQRRAVVSPETLPEKWREIIKKYPAEMQSATPLLVDAFQKSRIPKAYNMPDPMAYYLDSVIYPIRVYYYQESQLELATSVLEAADESWMKEIDEFGFYAPPITTPEEKYRIFIMGASGASGYTSPIGSYDETPWDDCVTYIVIEENSYPQMAKSTVAHELSHATQGAMDCMEPVVFWENTAVFTEIAVYPSIIGWMRYYAQYFQESPWWSISENETPYWYGGFLWPLFLADKFGSGPHDGNFVQEIWERSMQETGNSTNDPNYMETITEMIEEGGSTLDEAFTLFSVGRFFVGSDTSSGYEIIPFSDQLDLSVPIQKTIYVDEETTYEPPSSERPKPYGINYFRLRSDSLNRPTTIELKEESEVNSWQLTLAPINGSIEDIISSSSTEKGSVSIEFDPSETGDMLLLVINKGKDSFSFNSVPVYGTDYQLTVRPTVPLPEISTVLPQTVESGSKVTVTVFGSDFIEGATVEFFPADDIEITNINFIDSSKMEITLVTPEDTVPGVRQITVINPDEGQGSLASGLNFVDPVKYSTQPGSGCSSSGENNSSDPSILLIFTLMTFLIFRRKI